MSSGASAAFDADLAEEVAAFLRRHPNFLADRPDLYRSLLPPERVHGEVLADHMAAMLRAARAQAAELAARADSVLAAGRARAGLSHRVQEAVVSLMKSDDPAPWVEAELPPLLGLDAATICVEHYRPGTRRLPAGTVRRLLSGRDVVFRDHPSDAALLHAEAAPLARRDALVRVPGGPALLALACRDRGALPGEAEGAVLAFLGRALGWYDNPGEGPGIIASIIGAMLLLLLYRFFIGRRGTTVP